MPYGFYISAEGAQAQSARLDVIANNLANVDTVAFKRQLSLCQARYAEAIQKGQLSPDTGAIENVGGGVTMREMRTDFAQGSLKQTHQNSDMAIRGEGFFEVQNGDDRMLTRAGNFRISSRGELQTQQGYAVLGENGSPIVLPRPTEPWSVSAEGEIRQGDDVQRLALVRPDSLGDLARQGQNLFRPLAETRPLAPKERDVASGYLETSGTEPTSEMVALIEASRAMEANMNLMQTQDNMLSGLYNRALKIS